MTFHRPHSGPWRILVVAALLLGLGFPGPAKGVALSTGESSCCCSPASAEPVGLQSFEEREPIRAVLRLDAREHCACSIPACQVCADQEGLQPPKRTAAHSSQPDAGDRPASAHPTKGLLKLRAQTNPVRPSVHDSPSGHDIYLALNVLLI